MLPVQYQNNSNIKKEETSWYSQKMQIISHVEDLYQMTNAPQRIIKLWQVDSNHCLVQRSRINKGHKKSIQHSFLMNKTGIVSLFSDRSIRLTNLTTQQINCKIRTEVELLAGCQIDFSVILSGVDSKMISLYDIRSKKALNISPMINQGLVHIVNFTRFTDKNILVININQIHWIDMRPGKFSALGVYKQGQIRYGRVNDIFRDGVRFGYGILKFNHIEIYNGDWVNDQIQGEGKIRNCEIINKRQTIYFSQSLLGKWISYSGQFKSIKFQGSGIGRKEICGQFCERVRLWLGMHTRRMEKYNMGYGRTISLQKQIQVEVMISIFLNSHMNNLQKVKTNNMDQYFLYFLLHFVDKIWVIYVILYRVCSWIVYSIYLLI